MTKDLKSTPECSLAQKHCGLYEIYNEISMQPYVFILFSPDIVKNVATVNMKNKLLSRVLIVVMMVGQS